MKVLWLNENPVAETKNELLNLIETEFKNIELVNSEFTQNYTEWGLRFAHCYPHLNKMEKLNIEVLSSIQYMNLLPLYDF